MTEKLLNNTQPNAENPTLPSEVSGFTNASVEVASISFTADEWLSSLRATEIADIRQQIKLRPWFILGMFLLLVCQSVGIWLLVKWALFAKQLPELQLIFSAMIAGSLTQSYFIMRLITVKVFSDIDYHNGDGK